MLIMIIVTLTGVSRTAYIFILAVDSIVVSVSVVEEKVFVVLPQKLAPRVREGRRRQFNYIGTYSIYYNNLI